MKLDLKKTDDGTGISLSLDGVLGSEAAWVPAFSRSCGGRFAADIELAALREQLGCALERLRRSCYLKGVRDGRRRRTIASAAPSSLDLGYGIWERA